MSDNRGDWYAVDVAGNTSYPLMDRLFAKIGVFSDTVAAMARFLTYRSDLHRSRQQLRELSDAQLRDIGLTRRQANAEAGRPFFED